MQLMTRHTHAPTQPATEPSWLPGRKSNELILPRRIDNFGRITVWIVTEKKMDSCIGPHRCGYLSGWMCKVNHNGSGGNCRG